MWAARTTARVRGRPRTPSLDGRRRGQGTQLLLVRYGVALQRAAGLDEVGAQALQPGGVGVEADRRLAGQVGDAVDVRGLEVQRLAGRDQPPAGRPAQRQALLDDPPLDNRHRARRAVVVVEAGVLLAGPADQPQAEVLGPDQLVVGAAGGVVGDQVAPLVGAGGAGAHEREELRGGEVALRKLHRRYYTKPIQFV